MHKCLERRHTPEPVLVMLLALLAAGPLGCRRSEGNQQPEGVSSASAFKTPSAAPGAPAAPSARPPATAPAQKATLVLLSAHQDGSMLLDGAPMDHDAIIRVLSEMDPSTTLVRYYREAAREPPNPAVKRVMLAIAEMGLGVSFSTRPDFSDFIDENREVRPRQ